MAQTKLINLVNPQVMAQMISATLPKMIKFSKIAHIDDTLVGQAGNTITVPKYAYIGDAEDVAEGVAMGTVVLTASTTTATVKKAGKAVELTDEAVLSGYGDPMGEATRQLGMSIASKIDNDCYTALQGASLIYNGTTAKIGYTPIVEAVDLLEDEHDNSVDKIMFVHPKQLTDIRKDTDFKDINKYPLQTVMTGVIGEIAGCQIIPSKRVRKIEYVKDNSAGTITIVADASSETSTNKHLATIQPSCEETLVVGDKVKAVANAYYVDAIVVVDKADPNEDPSADHNAPSDSAITIYMKRAAEVESDRNILAKTTTVSADEHYTAVLSNDSKVVLAKIKA